MKALSIVIPVFNEAENLEHTLKSIRETECCPVDIIVVDDHYEDSYPYRQLGYNSLYFSFSTSLM